MPRPGLLDVCRAQRHADFWSVMCALVPSGRRRKREKRTNKQRDKSCFIPSLSASRPLTNATVARPRRSRAQHGLRAGARDLTCGSRGVSERGHARHGPEGSSRNGNSTPTLTWCKRAPSTSQIDPASATRSSTSVCSSTHVSVGSGVVGSRAWPLAFDQCRKARLEGWWVVSWVLVDARAQKQLGGVGDRRHAHATLSYLCAAPTTGWRELGMLCRVAVGRNGPQCQLFFQRQTVPPFPVSRNHRSHAGRKTQERWYGFGTVVVPRAPQLKR